MKSNTPTKTLRVTCEAAETVPIGRLVPLQGKLKVLSQSAYEKLRLSILKYGISFPFFVWRQNGTTYILDGHQRDIALRKMAEEGWKIPPIPIVFIKAASKKEAMEKILLISSRYGKITEEGLLEFAHLAEIDIAEFTKIGELPEFDFLSRGFVSKFMQDDKPEKGEQAEGDAGENQDPQITPTGIYQLKENAVLPSSNKWGIPDMRADMLATGPIPTEVYAHNSETARLNPTNYFHVWGNLEKRNIDLAAGAVLSFYRWDEKFEAVWDEAVVMIERLKTEKWAAVVAPNFSTWRDEPLAIQLFRIFQARWCARFWQEAGIKVIPDVDWGDERLDEFCLLGIPKKPPIICIRAAPTVSVDTDKEQARKLFARGLSMVVRQLEPKTVLLYAGATHKAFLSNTLPMGPRYVFLDSYMSAREKINVNLQKRKGKRGVSETAKTV